MRVLFPWPDKRLSPNARLHWARLAEAKAAAREAAAWDVKAQVPRATLIAVAQGDARIPMTITFYPPDARRRDDDNMVGSFKAIRDGLADALGVDDRRFQPHYFFADPCKPGFVEVFIHENGAETALPQGDDSAMESAAQGSASTLLLGLNIKPEKEAPMSLTPDRRIPSAAQSKIIRTLWPTHYVPPRLKAFPSDLVALVCRAYGLTLDELKGAGKAFPLIEARWILIRVWRSQGLSMLKIARLLGRSDHSFVANALDGFDARLAASPMMQRTYADARDFAAGLQRNICVSFGVAA